MRATLVVGFLLFLLLSVVPVVLVTGDSFLSEAGGLTLRHYREAFTPSSHWKALYESLLIAGAATLFALFLGVPYALFSTRVRVPGRSVFSALYVLPLVLPPLLMSMGWSQFLDGAERVLDAPALGEFLGGIKGAAFLLGLAYFPFVTLFARKAFLEIGAGFEDAARIHTGPLRTFLRITLPLALPTVLAGALFVFLFSLSNFSVVDYLSFLQGLKVKVSTYAFVQFGAWKTSIDPTIGRREAEALGTPVALLAVALLLLILWLHRKGAYTSVTSGHVRPGFLEDQRSRWSRVLLRSGGFLFMALVLLLSVGVPVGRLVHDAMGRNGDLIGNLQLALGSEGMGAGNGLPDLLNSLKYAVFAAVGMTVLATVLGHHMVRRGPRREALVLCLSFLPLAIGGIAFGAGLIRTWNHRWLEIGRFNHVYETGVIVVLMLIGKYLPFALAAVVSSLKRVDPGLEDAAAVAGVRPMRRLLRIVVPLAGKGIAAGFVLGFVFSMRELDTMSILRAGDATLMKKIYQWVHFGVGPNEASLSLVLIGVIALPLILYVLLTARRVRVF
jgi:iron(III) transport system permease protein